MKISGIIIAKNEENLIADAIDSLNFCDEVIVVDNFSTDRTGEVSEKLGAKVFKTDINDFSKLREKGMEKAEGDWVFYLDADERASEELGKEIEYRTSLPGLNAFELPRKNYYLGNNLWPAREYHIRLFKKEALKGWKGKLHESPVFEGKVGKLENPIVHFTHRDLSSMLDKTNTWSDIEAKTRLDGKHPKMSVWRFPRVMLPTFFSYYFRQGGYKKGTVGLIESVFQTYSIFITYAKLWELQESKSS